jgi:hypothetical protein
MLSIQKIPKEPYTPPKKTVDVSSASCRIQDQDTHTCARAHTHTHTHTAFPYTNNEHADTQIKNTIPFTTAPKKMLNETCTKSLS